MVEKYLLEMDSNSVRALGFIINYAVLIVSCSYGFNTLPIDHRISKILIILGVFISFLCLVLIMFIYHDYSKKSGELITTGLYSYVRHPFYLLIITSNYAISLSYLSIYSIFASTLLIILWWYLAKIEELELINYYGEEYIRYIKRVPMFLPIRIKKKKQS